MENIDEVLLRVAEDREGVNWAGRDAVTPWWNMDACRSPVFFAWLWGRKT